LRRCALAPTFIFSLATVPLGLIGCSAGPSIALQEQNWRVVPVAHHSRSADDTRAWLRRAQSGLSGLLSSREPTSLLTDDLVSRTGRATDVYEHFGLRPGNLTSILFNASGLLQSAHALADTDPDANWPGFLDVQVPVADSFEVSARMGLATAGDGPVSADCIVLIPGLLGDNTLARTRDLAVALRRSGLHVLSIEPRGCGQTQIRHPEVSSTFGVLETADLIEVSEWLRAQSHVRRVGLIGFCWGANQALLAAWEDGHPADDPDVAPRLREHFPPRSLESHFAAGILAFSPVLRFEEVVEKLDQGRLPLTNPVLDALGDGVRELARRRGYARPSTSLRELIERDSARSKINYPGVLEEGLRYLRMTPMPGKPAGSKLEQARTPVLIVHAANDPLCSAQAVADLCGRLANPLVAAMILPGGGHNGFFVYNRDYSYSLVLSFFDPRHGAAASDAGPRIAGSLNAALRTAAPTP
jgi:dienelactone hydrolase